MKKTVLALSAAAVCVASAAPVLAEGQNPMTAPVQISMQGEASMTVANDEAVILFSAESRRPDAVSASNDAAKRGNAAIEALKRFSDKIDVGTTGLSTNPVYTRAKEGEVSEIGAWEVRETLRVTVRDVSVASVRIGSHSAGGPRYYAAPMMKAERASANVAPAVSAGTTEVSLTVTVEARLPR